MEPLRLDVISKKKLTEEISLISGLFIIIGTFFILIAGIGLVRFPDIYTRMHAVSKSMTLGIGSVLLAAVIEFASLSVGIKSMLTILFLYLTIPVGSQVISLVAYRRNESLWDQTIIDEYGSGTAKNKKPARDEL